MYQDKSTFLKPVNHVNHVLLADFDQSPLSYPDYHFIGLTPHATYGHSALLVNAPTHYRRAQHGGKTPYLTKCPPDIFFPFIAAHCLLAIHFISAPPMIVF
ncbi:MAG: hypothetical protein LC725_02510 [Lentisphaerae bacterium]|nr:hypothetical protein [Lentisphaerota bacterium]